MLRVDGNDLEPADMPRAFKTMLLAVAALSLAGAARAGTGLESGLQRAFLAEAPSPLGGPAPRWAAMLERMSAEPGACEPGAKIATADCRFEAWQNKMAKLRDRSPRKRLKEVNQRVNALTYVADSANWGEADYWETPREMFERGGDCEGFAVTKYFALQQLGFTASDMRIAVVWDDADREQHAILLVRLGEDDIVVLDNKRAELASATRLSDRYRLMFYLNDGQIALPAVPLQTARRAPSRARLINGGRTLALRIEPRRERPDRIIPAEPAFALAVAETAVPAGR